MAQAPPLGALWEPTSIRARLAWWFGLGDFALETFSASAHLVTVTDTTTCGLAAHLPTPRCAFSKTRPAGPPCPTRRSPNFSPGDFLVAAGSSDVKGRKGKCSANVEEGNQRGTSRKGQHNHKLEGFEQAHEQGRGTLKCFAPMHRGRGCRDGQGPGGGWALRGDGTGCQSWLGDGAVLSAVR